MPQKPAREGIYRKNRGGEQETIEDFGELIRVIPEQAREVEQPKIQFIGIVR